MDDSMKLLLCKLFQLIPKKMLAEELGEWGRLSQFQRDSMDYTKTKKELSKTLLSYCEENELTARDVVELEIIHMVKSPKQKVWHTFNLMEPQDGAGNLNPGQFKKELKVNLRELAGCVSAILKKDTDDAIWIRIAWGDSCSEPNHLKPTYVVHYLQNPYFFVAGLTLKTKPLLFQALALSTRYGSIVNANLSGKDLRGFIDQMLGKYQQVFPTMYPTPLPESTEKDSNSHIERWGAEDAATRHHSACVTFGEGALPQLKTAVYKLETKFKGSNVMSECDGLFECQVEFSSTNLLESLRHCASLGIVSSPVSSLLSNITSKGQNNFIVKDLDHPPNHASGTTDDEQMPTSY